MVGKIVELHEDEAFARSPGSSRDILAGEDDLARGRRMTPVTTLRSVVLSGQACPGAAAGGTRVSVGVVAVVDGVCMGFTYFASSGECRRMAPTIDVPSAGFRFMPGVFQYSCGVVAMPGFRIERTRFAEPVPMAAGWQRIAAHLDAIGRPREAFCACELRSPEPFSEAGFLDFNQAYAAVLAEWGILRNGENPVARSNVCPEIAPPAEPGFHAFSYTVPEQGAPLSFIVAGSGESEEGHANYRDYTVAPGDTSPAGVLAKARWVLAEMERRMAALGGSWAGTTGVNIYTVFDIHPFLAEELVARGAARHGATWQFCRPPVAGLDYEMDCRRVAMERVLF